MSQSKKKETDNRSVEKTPDSKATASDRKGRRTGFIIASVVITLILVIVGVFYYREYVAPFRRIIITVDDTVIRMDYFLERTRLAGENPIAMLTVLTNEQIIKLAAPQYGIEVSPEDIDQALRTIARGESETIIEDEFKEWYRQQLNESGLSDSEFKAEIATTLLRARLHNYLAERMPTVAEQIHLQAIMVEEFEDAEKVRARWEAGEDFADLAREASIDEQSGGKGGDLGWFPRGVLLPGLDYVAFNLSPGEVSQPIPFATDPSSTEVIFYLIMVSEKADAREVNEEFLQVLRSQVLDDWLTQETQYHEIKYNFNSEINAWINWQLTK